MTPKSFLHGFIAIAGGKDFLFVCIEKNGAPKLFFHGHLLTRKRRNQKKGNNKQYSKKKDPKRDK